MMGDGKMGRACRDCTGRSGSFIDTSSHGALNSRAKSTAPDTTAPEPDKVAAAQSLSLRSSYSELGFSPGGASISVSARPAMLSSSFLLGEDLFDDHDGTESGPGGGGGEAVAARLGELDEAGEEEDEEEVGRGTMAGFRSSLSVSIFGPPELKPSSREGTSPVGSGAAGAAAAAPPPAPPLPPVPLRALTDEAPLLEPAGWHPLSGPLEARQRALRHFGLDLGGVSPEDMRRW